MSPHTPQAVQLRHPVSGAAPAAPVRVGFCLAVVVALVLGGPAAAWGKTRLAVLPFQGPGAEELEKALLGALPKNVGLVPLVQVDRALEKAGGKLPMSSGEYMNLASRVRASAVLAGRTSNGGPWRLRLAVREGGTGAPMAGVDITGRTKTELLANVRRQVPRSLRNLMQPAPVVPAQPEPAPVVQPEPPPPPAPDLRAVAMAAPAKSKSKARAARPAEEEQESAQADPEPEAEELPPPRTEARVAARAARPTQESPLLELSVGPRVLSRAFIYTDNVSGLPGYTLPAALGLFAEAEFYPAARSKSPVRNFGVAGLWEASMGATTTGRDGTGAHTTRSKSYRMGLRYRLQSPNFLMMFGGDYGEHQFDLAIKDAIAPNVVYSLLRPSVSGRAQLGSGLSLGVTAAYLHVLSVGKMGDPNRFPRVRAKGAEVGALLGYALDKDFEVRLVADLRHYAHHMHAKAGDPLVVGGAVDEHFGAALLISYRMR